MISALIIVFKDQARQEALIMPVVLRLPFSIAVVANNNTVVQPHLPPEIAEIQDQVAKNQGKVDPETARRFVNNVFYGGFGPPGGLKALPLETKLNLYESIASENNPGNAYFLGALNQEMGLTEAFYRHEAERMARFFSKDNAAALDRQWSGAGHAGTFSETMHRAIMHPEATSPETKKALINFIVSSFCEFTGQSRPKIDFFKSDPAERGYAAPDGSVIGINEKAPSFNENFLELLFTTMHELDHLDQMDLGKACRDGRLGRDHPLYAAGRVYKANLLSKFGYIPACNPVGHEVYEKQAAEVGANYAAEMAVCSANKLYGAGWRKPAPRLLGGPVLAAA